MKQELDRVLEEVRGAWRFRWIALAAAAVASVIGWGIVFALPDRYAADARVFVDTRTALKPALQGLTTDQNVDAQITYVRRSLLEGTHRERTAHGAGVLPASEQAQRLLETQIKDYEQRLSSAEDRLAAFKKKNVGLMPSEQGGYFAQLQSETDAAKKAETDLSIALSRRDELSKQLHSDTAVSA